MKGAVDAPGGWVGRAVLGKARSLLIGMAQHEVGGLDTAEMKAAGVDEERLAIVRNREREVVGHRLMPVVAGRQAEGGGQHPAFLWVI